MEAWALRAMERWPNVPALFGWLGLDRRGRWLIRGEVITRPQIIDTINGNYEADAHGRWFFQNGPQRGFVSVETAPLVLSVNDGVLLTHTQRVVRAPAQVLIDEDGGVAIATEHGAGSLLDTDLDWALANMTDAGRPLDEYALTKALETPSGSMTALEISIGDRQLRVMRMDREALPGHLGFVRDPAPRENERVATRVAD
ncbi:hypothetical protein HNQ60_004143 [Povalibacter uvarum]|uniref:DUF2946 family protein n=1 Tax=Povalibacter uvarum TaxID=732238 RepID=A0A841HR64_9GAMM|nr:DUF2946 family protein [Povalibacter uvarum]MBB6095253.1 hypothetical protein [Povalibacter uvarum]